MRGSVFITHDLLIEMLTLRSKGKSFMYLAKEYHVDHTSIIYHCKKYNVQKNRPLPELKISINSVQKPLWTPAPKMIGNKKYRYQEVLEERICLGKSYQQYLLEERERKNKKTQAYQ